MLGKVLVADELERGALARLRQHAEVVYQPGLSPEELAARLSDCAALVVRSGTRVTRRLLEAAPCLRVVGRAGVGVDNVDVEAATERGVWVVNAPNSNAVAVAEHVFALLLSLARRVPWAWDSLRRGEWQRGAFRGVELAGKTLGIIGLGRTGTRVAERAKALGMTVAAYDPFLAPAQATALGVELLPLDALLAVSDFVSLHVPGAPGTAGLIGRRELAACKPGAYLVNCSRGTVVDEAALLEALDCGRLAGAALDVFSQEPPLGSRLVAHPKVVATPHIAGMTEEAQQNVALAVVDQVLDVLQGKQPLHPVNAPALSAEELARIGPYLDLGRRLGRFYAQIAGEPTISVQVTSAGQLAEMDAGLVTAAVLEGLLAEVSDTPVNLINSRLVARQRGISVSETTAAETGPFSSLLTLCVGTPNEQHLLAGTVLYGQPHVVRVSEFWISFIPAGMLLYTEHIEQPGILGRMGTLLGEHGVNISFVQVGRHARGGRGVMILGVDDVLGEAVLAAVMALPSVVRARMVQLPPSEK